MKKILLCLICLLIGNFSFAHEVENLSADEAMKLLKVGNEHFRTMHLNHPHQTKKARESLVKGQHPFVAILTCSDSRVPAEIIFDQGLGDIFEIRNAGNVLDDHVIGSIEYAVVHLGVKLVVVMGHEDCGAVTATVNNVDETKYINSLIKSIKPALKMYEKEHQEGCKLTNVIKNNAILNVESILDHDGLLKDYVKNKGLKIVPAYYHLSTGEVEFLTK